MALSRTKLEDATLETVQFTYRDLLALEAAGVLGDRRVELLGGQLVIMTVNPPHAAAVSHLNRRLNQALSGRAQIIVQSPLRLSGNPDDKDLPEPDVMVVKDPDKVYPDHPHPEDVYLLVEVSDSTLQKDRGVKLALYARHGIGEYWIVNLPDERIEVYTEPQGDDYLTKRSFGLLETVPIQSLDVKNVWLPEGLPPLLSGSTG